VRSRIALAVLVAAIACAGCGLDFLALLGTAPRHERRVRVGDATLEVEVSPRNLTVPIDDVVAWVEDAAHVLADYCGCFPIDGLLVRVVSGVPGGVWFGQHWHGDRVGVLVGGATTREDLASDHVLLHELSHTAFPSLHRRHLWMREGLSTYLESVLRVREGVVEPEAVWALWVRAMPRGLPRAGHRGLDFDGGIGRTYWGGALWWLLVDVDVRAQTGGRRSARDVVREACARGADSRQLWTIERALAMADDATETTAPTDRYQQLARRPGAVNLDALWARLGVVSTPDGVTLDDDAPLAHVRRAITASQRAQSAR